MKTFLKLILLFVLISPVTVKSQQVSQPDSLLNKLAGKWVLTGTIEGQKTIHDVDAKRVLNGQYVQIKEVSREKDEKETRFTMQLSIFVGRRQKNNTSAFGWIIQAMKEFRTR